LVCIEKVTFEYRKENGNWETQSREVYDRANGATILLYNRLRQTVVLTKQFRMPTFKNGNESGILIETCAGLLDNETPEASILRETEEEKISRHLTLDSDKIDGTVVYVGKIIVDMLSSL
jgi:GDP-mannose pyrophosphatase NudK